MTDQQTTGSPKNDQDLWDYFAQNHSLSLLESELSDIRHTVSATQELEIRSCHNQINALRAENERLKSHLTVYNNGLESIAIALGFTRCSCKDPHCGAWFPPDSEEPCLLGVSDILKVIEKGKKP